jgi:hypothetical protein
MNKKDLNRHWKNNCTIDFKTILYSFIFLINLKIFTYFFQLIYWSMFEDILIARQQDSSL